MLNVENRQMKMLAERRNRLIEKRRRRAEREQALGLGEQPDTASAMVVAGAAP